MGVSILNVLSQIVCLHAGKATPVVPFPRVTIAGSPISVLSTQYAITGCTLPPAAGGPCVTATFLNGATRVTADGQPVLLQTSQATCSPTGTGVQVVQSQPEVTAE